MKAKLKVLTMVGTRPEIIRLSRVISLLDEQVQHIFVHTGQNYDYELNQVFFDELGLRKPDHFLNVDTSSMGASIGDIMRKTEEVLKQEKPGAFLVLGDTNSCLAAYIAKRLHIPVFHMEAGNRCFDQRVPEELNRKVLDHLSDINMVLTEHARRYLIAEGIAPDRILKTGSHMPEVLAYHRPQIEASGALARLDLQKGRYFLVSSHREENVDSPENLAQLLQTLQAMATTYDLPVIVSTHPRTAKRLEALQAGATQSLDSRIRFLKPFGFIDYIRLQMDALCVVSDSGTITEEASLLGFAAVTIRNAHERPEGMDQGTLIMCGLKAPDVLHAIGVTVSQRAQGATSPPPDYLGGAVSQKVLKAVLSYTAFINRVVWSK